jgi:hypothetical protein
MSLTPLKEAWILDDIVLSGRSDIGVIDGLSIVDNPDLYEGDRGVLAEMGLTSDQADKFFEVLLYDDLQAGRFVSDQGKRAELYLKDIAPDTVDEGMNRLKIMRFIRDIEPNDVPARVFGVFRALIGRVLKEFDKDIHWVEPFKIGADWPVVAMIDFHLSKPQAISFHAYGPHGMQYIVKEIWENLSPDEIADEIIRAVRVNGWLIEYAFIDPLSKGDTQYMKNRAGSDVRDSFSILSEKLADAGIILDVGSKDKVSGIKNIQDALKGANSIPTYFIFNTCVRHLHEVQRWVYDDNDKPVKENDHFMENWYRATLTGVQYDGQRGKPRVSRPRRNFSWMGA